MKKKLLNGINAVLGAMSLGLLGCSTTGPKCIYGPPPEPEKYGCPEELIVEKYGVPTNVNEPEPVIEPEPIPVKYGVPEPKPLYGVPPVIKE